MVGLLASRLINVVDWQSLFYIGGILPLGLSIMLIRALPDSIEFLVMRGAARRDIRDLVMRMCPTVDIASGCQFVIDDERTRGVPVSQLFPAGMVGGTVLLWVSYFVTFMMLVTGFAGFFSWCHEFRFARAGAPAVLHGHSLHWRRLDHGPSADSVLLSDRSPLACSSTGVGRSATALPHSGQPLYARLCSRA